MRMTSRATLRNLLITAAAPAAIMLGAATASAQRGQDQGKQLPRTANGGQQELFEWQGPVDREIRIQMSGNRAVVERIGNNERAGGRVRTFAGTPAQDGIVTIQQSQGRGTVDVVQQPTRGNGFTTIVRLRDPQSGVGMYRIAAFWQPTGNGQYRNDRQRNGNRGRNRNGSYDNGSYGRDHDR